MTEQLLNVGDCVVLRSKTGAKLLTVSRDQIGYRYYRGAKPGGGGRKRTRCTEYEASLLLGRVGKEAGK